MDSFCCNLPIISVWLGWVFNVELTTNMVQMHVEHCEKRERIAFDSIRLDGRPNSRLVQNKLCKSVNLKLVRVALEKLLQQSLDCMEIDFRIWVEEVKGYVDYALGPDYERFRRFKHVYRDSQHQKKRKHRRCRRQSLVFVLPWCV